MYLSHTIIFSNMNNIFFLLLSTTISLQSCAQRATPAVSYKIDGLTMVAPPRPFDSDPMVEIAEVNAGWIALVPYGFTRSGETSIRFGSDRQWWGERTEGIIECINIAHEAGVKVMVKPQVYMHRDWVGDMDFATEEEWVEWEESYRYYIITFAKVAAKQKAEMFCIGTEYKIAAQKRENYWRSLIAEIRTFYTGEITYSSNWDGYESIPFWDDLDYIGLSAYFPLSDNKTPKVSDLIDSWKGTKKTLQKLSRREGKPILFTEYGYMSVDKCAWRAWEIEKERHKLLINEEAQANALEALYAVFWDEPWWGGGFMWKWFPNGMGHEGYFDKDYTPQGKKASETVAKWYGLDD